MKIIFAEKEGLQFVQFVATADGISIEALPQDQTGLEQPTFIKVYPK